MATENEQNVGATAFDLPNSQHPGYDFKAKYGKTPVPHPTNAEAKKVPQDKVMSAVLQGK